MGTGNVFPFSRRRREHSDGGARLSLAFLGLAHCPDSPPFSGASIEPVTLGQPHSAPPAAGPCLLLALGSGEQPKNYFLLISKERKLLLCHLRQECCQKAGILGGGRLAQLVRAWY